MPLGLVSPSIALFVWTAGRSKYEHYLRGFPVATADQDDESATIIELSRHPQPDDRPIAPPGRWPEALQPFAPLFPRRKILNDEFGQANLGLDDWQLLERHGLVTLGPAYRTARKANSFIPDEFTGNENSDEHESTEPLMFTEIAYLTQLGSEREAVTSLRAELEAARVELRRAQDAAAQFAIEKADLATRLDAERQQATEKLELLNEARQTLSDQFKTLANDILEEKSKRFVEQNQTNLGQLLDPLKVKITEFQSKVEDVSFRGTHACRCTRDVELGSAC